MVWLNYQQNKSLYMKVYRNEGTLATENCGSESKELIALIYLSFSLQALIIFRHPYLLSTCLKFTSHALVFI